MKKLILVAAVAAIAAIPGWADERVSRTSTIAWSAEGVKRVEVQVPPSEIQVRTAPIDRVQVEVEYRIERGNEDQEWLDSVLDGLSIEAIRKDTRLILRDKREGAARSSKAKRRDIESKITLTLPEWTSVELRQTAGEVDLSGSLGNVLVSMKAGEIRMKGSSADVRRLKARARVGEVRTEIGSRRESREGLFAGAAEWNNPSSEASSVIELLLTVGEISVNLE
ncbi:MAG: hypothetical protein KY459_11050 [Acidobacteria bacterium]|nr:hypothetical protein [Acidobacteriota bacterium]